MGRTSRCCTHRTARSSSWVSPRRRRTTPIDTSRDPDTRAGLLASPRMRGTSVTLAGAFLEPIRGLFMYQFMVNALWAAIVVAIMAGALGWFMVLRGQTFAGHTVSI